MSYAKPSGYNSAVRAGASGYKPFNGALSAPSYSPTRPRRSLPYSFSAAPADGSQIVAGGITFTFTYSGSPGAGIIPLVAGGGTAAQAATAAQVAMSAQLSGAGWTVTNPTSAVLTLLTPPNTLPIPSLVDTTNMTLGGNTAIIQGAPVPGLFGRNYCTLGT